ncbi:hypothetical protein [uncultured Roseobacter sp.]|uniref:hypothetical protein n=1 Tax=uncultured Roseobacter sp. TaxID=114847 RepID=UPI0026289E1F|nr:hypothetical protein [uncultured Roseobacter sp.]
MVGFDEHGALKQQFRSTLTLGDFQGAAKALLTPADAQDYKQHATISDAIFRKTDDYNQAGLKGGSVENIHKTSALASKDARNSPEQEAVRKSKRQYDDTLFLALLQRGDLDNFVAENTFSGMSDAEINDVVAQIETESGQSFEDYAKDILGENMPERRPGESDADYNRRVLTAVAEEVLNDDLTFKPGYENDPIARIIRRSEVYKEAQEFVDRTNAAVPENAMANAEAQDAVSAKANEGYTTSRILGEKLDNQELSGTSRDVQDEKRDARIATSTSGLAGLAALKSGFNSLADAEVAAAAPAADGAKTPDAAPVVPMQS